MAKTATRRRRLSEGYSFAGFRPKETVRGIFGDPDVRIVSLDRRSKKQSAVVAGASRRAGMTGGYGKFATCRVQDFGLFWNSKCGASRVGAVAP
jgi:hypothetical protein